MSEYFGTKAVYGLGLFLSGITMFLTPVVAKADVYGFMALRVLLGIFEGINEMIFRKKCEMLKTFYILRSHFSVVVRHHGPVDTERGA